MSENPLRRYLSTALDIQRWVIRRMSNPASSIPDLDFEPQSMLRQLRPAALRAGLPAAVNPVEMGAILDKVEKACITAYTVAHVPSQKAAEWRTRGLRLESLDELTAGIGSGIGPLVALLNTLEQSPIGTLTECRTKRLAFDLDSCAVVLDGQRYEKIDGNSLRALHALEVAHAAGKTPISRKQLREKYLEGCHHDRTLSRWLRGLPDKLQRLVHGTKGSGLQLIFPPEK